jgi:hypothetical protein
MNIRKMIDNVKNVNLLNEEKEKHFYKVYETKYRWSGYKEILFSGNYDECIIFITKVLPDGMDVIMEPVDYIPHRYDNNSYDEDGNVIYKDDQNIEENFVKKKIKFS